MPPAVAANLRGSDASVKSPTGRPCPSIHRMPGRCVLAVARTTTTPPVMALPSKQRVRASERSSLRSVHLRRISSPSLEVVIESLKIMDTIPPARTSCKARSANRIIKSLVSP